MLISKQEKTPHFIICGAAKCGTTSLYYYLKQFPDIFLPSRKELKFFGEEKINKLYTDYLPYFHPATCDQVIGEVSSDYLYHKSAAKYMKELCSVSTSIINFSMVDY